MIKTENYICDINKCDKEAHMINKQMQVIFLTEQTEGRNITPYFSNVNIDLCKDCVDKILEYKKYIKASGAMGHNKYYIS